MNISAIAYSVSSFLANVTCCITIPSLKKVFVSCIFVTIVATIIKLYNYDLQYYNRLCDMQSSNQCTYYLNYIALS